VKNRTASPLGWPIIVGCSAGAVVLTEILPFRWGDHSDIFLP
jgi:hypothetical protein